MATVEELTAELALYKAQEAAILKGGQSYGVSGRQLTRANLDTIIKKIASIETRIARVSRTGGTITSPDFGA